MSIVQFVKSVIARVVPFDNSTNGFISDEVQSAIEEVSDNVSTSASPGFSLGRAGNIPSGTWLYRTGQIPSNRTGIPMAITNPAVTLVAVGNENINTFDVEVYEHDGDEINLTLLGTVSMIAARTGTFTVNWPATSGMQLAGKVVNGSGKSVGVDLQLSGSQ